MPQILTEEYVADAAASLSDKLTDYVIAAATEFARALPWPTEMQDLMRREIEKVTAVQILDGTRHNAGAGTDA